MRLVSATYDLTAVNVITDARDVATWDSPSDDGLLTLIDIRRGLGVAETACYLRLLRTALVVGAASVNNRRAMSAI